MKKVPKPPKIKTRHTVKLYKGISLKGAEKDKKKWEKEKRIHRKKKKEYFENQMKQVEKLYGLFH